MGLQTKQELRRADRTKNQSCRDGLVFEVRRKRPRFLTTRWSYNVLSSSQNPSKHPALCLNGKTFAAYLVGGLEHFLFSIIYGIILPIDELIFFKMVIALHHQPDIEFGHGCESPNIVT